MTNTASLLSQGQHCVNPNLNRRKACQPPRRVSRRSQLFLLCCSLAASLLITTEESFALEVGCDTQFVIVQGAALLVKPSQNNDRINLQCALDEASRLGIGLVSLEPGNYLLDDTIVVRNFEGRIQGRTRTSTTIKLRNKSFNCSQRGNAFRFITGRPTVASMNFISQSPCVSGDNFTTLNFLSNGDDCNARTLFAKVDRVDFANEFDTSSVTVAVSASTNPDCPSNLKANGALKVNRSSITGHTFGVLTSLGAGSQVDINFNTFENNARAIAIQDANQNTTITSNDIVFGTGEATLLGAPAVAVESGSSLSAPDTNRTVIHNNRFVDRGDDSRSAAILLLQNGNRQNHSVLITLNSFDADDLLDAYGIVAADIDGGVIQSNRFTGRFNASIQIGRNRNDVFPNGWSIAQNNFSNVLSLEADIWLTSGTREMVVGPQSADVLDSGSRNFIESRSNSVRANFFGTSQ